MSRADATRLNEGLRRVIIEKEIEITRKKGQGGRWPGERADDPLARIQRPELAVPRMRKALRNMVLVGFREYLKPWALPTIRGWRSSASPAGQCAAHGRVP